MLAQSAFTFTQRQRAHKQHAALGRFSNRSKVFAMPSHARWHNGKGTLPFVTLKIVHNKRLAKLSTCTAILRRLHGSQWRHTEPEAIA